MIPAYKPTEKELNALQEMIHYVDIATSFDAYTLKIVKTLYEQLKG